MLLTYNTTTVAIYSVCIVPIVAQAVAKEWWLVEFCEGCIGLCGVGSGLEVLERGGSDLPLGSAR